MAFESAERIGCLCIPTGGMSSLARLKIILDNAATVLCCTPTYAIRLGETAAESGLDLQQSKVRRIIVAGEPGGSIPATRTRIEQLWPGARVFDHHGMTEVGPVTYECPAQPGVLHVIEDGYYAEVIDPRSGKPMQAGEPGELALTTLGRIASPLLRYRTGDLVKARAEGVETCRCGSSCVALEGGILGRVDDMVIIRGVNIYPGAVEEIVRAVAGVAEYQVAVTSQGALAELSLAIEPAPGVVDPTALVGRLSAAFETAFSLRVPISLVAPDSLPRYEMKAHRWKRA